MCSVLFVCVVFVWLMMMARLVVQPDPNAPAGEDPVRFALDVFPFAQWMPKIPLPTQHVKMLNSSIHMLLEGDERPGVQAMRSGVRAYFPVVMVPGVVTTGLEVWQGEPCAKDYFRQRLWGSANMVRSIIMDTECWLRHIALDGYGLDPPNIKLRPAAGLEAADYLIGPYWVWAKLIENLSDIGYDVNSLFMAAYDWRLSFKHSQLRDFYFTKLKYTIELAKLTNHNRKVVIVCHSMGCLAFQYFLSWVSSPIGGGEEDTWCDEHLESVITVGNPQLGVTKVFSSLLSGEMKDTAWIAPFIDYVRDTVLVSQHQILNIFRTFRSLLSMWPKGNNVVWDEEYSEEDITDSAANGTHKVEPFVSFMEPIPW